MSKWSFQHLFKSGRRKSKWQDSLEAQLRQQQQRAELFSALTLKIRQSLPIQDILNTAVTQVQHILNVDRVLIYQVLPNDHGKTISEAVLPDYPALMNLEFPQEVFPKESQQLYAQGQARAIANVHDPASGLADCLVKFVAQFGIQSKLIAPIVHTPHVQPSTPAQTSRQNQLWGLLIAHHCRSPRQWLQSECELMQQLADQISIALEQARLLEHLAVEARTAELKATHHALHQEITVRRQTEAAIRQREDRISLISHELRTTLGSLHSALKVLATGRLGLLSAEGQHLIAIADESTERLIRLANNMLELQRIESEQVVMALQACSAADLMIQAIEAMRTMAQQYDITLRVQPKDLLVWADADYLVQTLINLLSNAIKFSPPGKSVWLTVDENDLSSAAEVIFRVRDEGQGIPVDQLDRIFERFQQVDSTGSRKRGFGLGLTICRRIIEQHHGKIWAESCPGCGSTFAFTLPALHRGR